MACRASAGSSLIPGRLSATQASHFIGFLVILEQVISGGQTGVDRAALDAALSLHIPVGGWCPKGRRSEDGYIPDRYPLQETPSTDYKLRTEWNVRDSDGTLVLTAGKATGGTALTITTAEKHKKPCLVLDLAEMPAPGAVAQWIEANRIRTLNVAGPRESGVHGIYEKSLHFIQGFLAPLL